MKRVSIILPCVALALISAEIFFHRQIIGEFFLPNENLSERAQEFIAKQRSSGTSLWNAVSFETPSPNVLGVQSIATSCFEVQFPYAVIEQGRQENQASCSLNVKVVARPITLSIHTQPWNDKLMEYPGVNLRIADPRKYQQENSTLPGESLVFADPESTVLFVLRDTVLRTIAISGGMDADRTVRVVDDLYTAIKY